MKKNIINFTLSFVLITSVFISCKKDSPAIKTTNSRSDLTKDSIFLYAKEIYLWNSALPTFDVFNPRRFSSYSANLDNYNAELFAITQYKINPLTSKAYEYSFDDPTNPKYSYIEDLVASGKLSFNNDKSSVGLDGNGDDLGYSLALVGTNANYKVYFQYTSPGSPSALAGLGRGDYIDKINGQQIGTNFSAEQSFINTAINQSTITLGGKKKNGTAYNVVLTKAKYVSSPIYKDSILTVGNKKVGYLAYARFSNTDNSEETLTNIFSKFSAGGVTDLVIDLRYNGGGFVSTAEHLINLIAPTSVNGKVMFSEAFNADLQSGKKTILKNQPLRDQSGAVKYSNGRIVTYADLSYTVADNTYNFAKKGSLTNVAKVIFITTDRTASASELVINSLKPYVDVKTVGSTSYGKPVGFFPIRIDKYDVYMSLFSSTNSLGQGNYFAGITPDSQKDDDVTRDFGNSAELCLASAISYINNGVFTSSTSNQTMSINGVSQSTSNVMIKDVFTPNNFKGMIYSPKGMK
jgi:carboxyl-terminal processing protease